MDGDFVTDDFDEDETIEDENFGQTTTDPAVAEPAASVTNPVAVEIDIDVDANDADDGALPTTPTTLKPQALTLELLEEPPSAGASELRLRAEEIQKTHAKVEFRMLVAICVLNIFVNFDGGSLPATLAEMKEDFGLSYSDVGALGALTFLGVALFAPIAGFMLTRAPSQRVVVLCAIAGNSFACLWFALSPSSNHLFFARFLMGITQCSIIVYSPVWVDEFAPPESATSWMACMQGSVALGVMVGYITGGIMVQTLGPKFWRLAIVVQSIGLGCFVPVYGLVDHIHVDSLGGKDKRIQLIMDRLEEEEWLRSGKAGPESPDGSPSSPYSSPRSAKVEQIPFSEQLKKLLSNGLYVILTLGLSGLYFVVTGIQFWATDYLTESPEKGGLGASKDLVIAAFAITCLTAPTAGVIFGGWYVDKLGGYKDLDGTGDAVVITLRTCLLFGIGAVCAAMPAAFIPNFWAVITCIWVVLFFGGSLLPPATGVCVNAVAPELRSLSSAFSMCAYNALGYASAPYLCGLIAQNVGLTWGYRTIMLMSTTAVFTLGGAYLIAKRYSAALRDALSPDGNNTDNK